MLPESSVIFPGISSRPPCVKGGFSEAHCLSVDLPDNSRISNWEPVPQGSLCLLDRQYFHSRILLRIVSLIFILLGKLGPPLPFFLEVYFLETWPKQSNDWWWRRWWRWWWWYREDRRNKISKYWQGVKLGDNSMGICYPILNAFGHIVNPQTKKQREKKTY